MSLYRKFLMFHLHIILAGSVCRFIYSFYLANFSRDIFFRRVVGMSLYRKLLMFYLHIISAGSVCRFFYILVVSYSCRSYYFISSLLTSVVFAGISICQKCMKIHSSHYFQYYFIVLLQEYPSAGSD